MLTYLMSEQVNFIWKESVTINMVNFTLSLTQKQAAVKTNKRIKKKKKHELDQTCVCGGGIRWLPG